MNNAATTRIGFCASGYSCFESSTDPLLSEIMISDRVPSAIGIKKYFTANCKSVQFLKYIALSRLAKMDVQMKWLYSHKDTHRPFHEWRQWSYK